MSQEAMVASSWQLQSFGLCLHQIQQTWEYAMFLLDAVFVHLQKPTRWKHHHATGTHFPVCVRACGPTTERPSDCAENRNISKLT